MPSDLVVKRFVFVLIAAIAGIYFSVHHLRERHAKNEAEQAARLESNVSQKVASDWIASATGRTNEVVTMSDGWVRLEPDMFGEAYFGRPENIRVDCNDDLHDVLVGFGDEAKVSLFTFRQPLSIPEYPYHRDSPASSKLHAMVCKAVLKAITQIVGR